MRSVISPEDIDTIYGVMEEENPYRRGWYAGYTRNFRTNPYESGTSEHEQWELGRTDGDKAYYHSS